MNYQQIKRSWEIRKLEMQKLRERAWTFRKIGEQYRLTPQRVQQILASKPR